MIKVFVLILCIKGILGSVRIVGGFNASIKSYPYQLSLQYKEKHFCGASIIGETWAITAAHCTDDGMKPKDFTVRAGSSFLYSGGQVVKVKSIYMHPQYNPDVLDYDIALLELKKRIKFTRKSSAIPLVDANATLNYEEKAKLTGWGRREDGVVAKQLQAVILPLISQEKCISAHYPEPVTSRMFCAGYIGGGKDACKGDSGGPLVVAGKLAGIVSWGKKCIAPNYPGVYSNVAVLRDFVTDVAGI